jgi:hypothetical protein
VPRCVRVVACARGYTYALIHPHAHICMEKRGCMHAPANACHRYMPTYTYPCIYLDSHVRPRRIEHRRSASKPHRAPAADSGAYPEQRRHRRGVPRTDLRVERRRPVERLRAEPHAVHADGKCSKVRREHTCVRVRACCAHPCTETHKHAHPHSQMHARARTHTHTHTRARARAYTGCTHPHKYTHPSTLAYARARTHPQTPTWTHTCAPVHVYLSISTCIDRRRYTALSVRTCVHAHAHGSTRAHMRTPIAHVPAHRSTHTHTHIDRTTPRCIVGHAHHCNAYRYPWVRVQRCACKHVRAIDSHVSSSICVT